MPLGTMRAICNNLYRTGWSWRMQLFGTRGSRKTLCNELDKAAREGNVEGVRAALDAGANVNPHRRYGRAPLSPAIRSGSMETVRLLLERGANPNCGETRWYCPLYFAVNIRSLEMVRLLIEYGVQVNPRVINTKPLMCAAALGEKDILRC